MSHYWGSEVDQKSCLGRDFEKWIDGFFWPFTTIRRRSDRLLRKWWKIRRWKFLIARPELAWQIKILRISKKRRMKTIMMLQIISARKWWMLTCKRQDAETDQTIKIYWTRTNRDLAKSHTPRKGKLCWFVQRFRSKEKAQTPMACNGKSYTACFNFL